MKSPLKEKPARLPGQSQDEYLSEFIDDKLVYPLVIIAVVIVLIVIEWVKYLNPTPPRPVLFSLIGLFVIVYSFYVIKKNMKKAGKIRLGRDGERTVGQHLEELRTIGCSVIHDVQGDNFNLDHVLVCPQGVFTVETKTWSKRDSHETIKLEGANLVVNGQKSMRHPIEQSLSQSRWLRNTLREFTGRDFAVRSVLVFPGWFIDKEANKFARGKGVWLLNPKALPEFIKKTPPIEILTNEDIHLITSSLESYSRSKKIS